MSTANLITGGAGFVGSNLAHRLLSDGERVILLDNLSRPNVERNVAWLRQTFGARSELQLGDIRDAHTLRKAVEEVDNVFHFAAQAAVSTSLAFPALDFDVNARGTLDVLEAARTRNNPPAFFYTSTNKVYGALPQLLLRAGAQGYAPISRSIHAHGVAEDTPLDFHSPCGCSKGAADQYVRDYARSFGLRSVVFRMSCIYGPRQFGTEDQGWVAHFMLRALKGETICIYGDGQQTRDLLYVSDLVEAFLAARATLNVVSGEAFNIGGGPQNAVSLLSVLRQIGEILGAVPEFRFEDWRAGDQAYYVSDTRKFSRMTGWSPKVSVADGLLGLERWLQDTGLAAPASRVIRDVTGHLDTEQVTRATGNGSAR